MRKNIPFVQNSKDNMHCVNSVFRMVSKSLLGKDFTWEEVEALESSMRAQNSPVPYAFIILGLLRSKNPLTRELSRIIQNNIDINRLSDQEQLLIQIMNIV